MQCEHVLIMQCERVLIMQCERVKATVRQQGQLVEPNKLKATSVQVRVLARCGRGVDC